MLTWNPKHFALGGEGSEDGSLNYNVGDEITWFCNSKKPVSGDTIYLIRLGEEPRGLIARGTVVQESFLEPDFRDPTKERTCIRFRFDELRLEQAQGSLPMLLLQCAFEKQQWSPQSSGIEIQPQYISGLNSLWESSRDKHSLEVMLRWCYDSEDWSNDWLERYKTTCQRVAHVRETGVAEEDDLSLLWYSRDNGIAGLRQGGISKNEFLQNRTFLEELTFSILNDPSPENHQSIYDRWSQEGDFKHINRALINRVFGAADPEKQTSGAINHAPGVIINALQKQFLTDISSTGNWSQDNQNLLAAIKPFIANDWDVLERNIALWHFYEWVYHINKSAKKNSSESTEPKTTEQTDYRSSSTMPAGTNTILYGPPGTGKTFHTVELAVRKADPEFNPDAAPNTVEHRTAFKARYDELVSQKRIRFVTFHQSFSYEEFVEGLRASSDDGQISYNIESGIFRRICDDAASGVTESNSRLDEALQALQEILGGEDRIELTTQRGNSFGVEYHGNRTFRIFPEQTSNEDLGRGYPVSIEHIQNLYRRTNLDRIYNSSYVKGILRHLMEEYSVPEFSDVPASTAANDFVLIIDEINRGNISKIFGELITLIEPSKRAGQPEELTVQLPYSKDDFSIPSNLHIIGTMNTADRSLAMMDTALRRRFDFVEMMPDYEPLNGVMVGPVNIGNMLRVINQRIEYLYDREHTLGHAFFMPLKGIDDEQALLQELGSIFRNKVIPLLEEYFFEDWEKIRLVLWDNQTKADDEQFILKNTEATGQSLFGSNYEGDALAGDNITYSRNPEALDNIQAYIKITSGSGE
ncbi:AAA family ATPase [Sansalvadorimonas sp. 2012CJ34-2]|uniref:AAA family ATPase n=1 Tax=Parendozoicomonas callyspongiae TaxID=2942213 RepID=A0ABT0PLD0_9GAMM|nr:AAA family ATPase [Sansalvadorimonas sp. 2012CJ34-2]MCL6272153.1 AAA family ATPase [Sansalvadorimonas sp. 2012CJ34-2]